MNNSMITSSLSFEDNKSKYTFYIIMLRLFRTYFIYIACIILISLASYAYNLFFVRYNPLCGIDNHPTTTPLLQSQNILKHCIIWVTKGQHRRVLWKLALQEIRMYAWYIKELANSILYITKYTSTYVSIVFSKYQNVNIS